MEEEKQTQIQALQDTIAQLKASLAQASSMLRELNGGDGGEDGQVVEGRFDGKDMIGPDGKRYTVPANYASKSKLVEGDSLKLVIGQDGGFTYKQIGPIERKRVRGTLVLNEDTGEYSVMAEGGTVYKLLKASVTYYRGEEGDEVIALIPDSGISKWAALENIIKVLS